MREKSRVILFTLKVQTASRAVGVHKDRGPAQGCVRRDSSRFRHRGAVWRIVPGLVNVRAKSAVLFMTLHELHHALHHLHHSDRLFCISRHLLLSSLSLYKSCLCGILFCKCSLFLCIGES